MKLYTFDGQTFKSLPDPFQNMSPMTDELFEQLGGTITEDDTPTPEQEFEAACAQFRTICGAIGQFIDTLKPELVKNVVCFGSCAIIDSPVPQMRKMLEAKGIRCDERSFTCKGSMGPVHSGHPNQQDLADLRAFIEKTIK